MKKERKTATQAWLERCNPLAGMSIRALQGVFDSARGGDTQRLHWIFQEIEAANPTLTVCVDRRASAIANFQWRVSEIAALEGELSAEQKDAAERFLAGIDNLTDALEHLDLAFFRGFSHCQPIWETDGKVPHISLLDSWKFLRKDGEWYYNPECTGFNGSCTDCRYARLMTVMRRRPIDYPALGVHVRDAVGNRDWGRFLERHALPKPAVTMHAGATEEDRNKYLKAAEAVENGQVSVWPNGASLMDFAGGSRGVDPFKNFIEHQEETIVRLATGGTLGSIAESGSGTLAGGAQQDVWESIVARDSSVIAQAANRALLRPFIEKAFPGHPCAVEFGFDFTKPPTPKEVFETAAAAKAAGYRISKDELEEQTGYTLEDAPDPASNGFPTPFGGGLRALNSRQEAPTPFKTRENVFKNASRVLNAQGEGEPQPPSQIAKKRPSAQSALEALSKDSSKVAQEISKLMADPSPEAARALLDKLPSLLPEDPALAAVIAEAMAEAYGAAAEQPTNASNAETQRRGGDEITQEEAEKLYEERVKNKRFATPEQTSDVAPIA